MATIATGQISIVDYNDALTLTGFIGSNHPKTQQYNPDNATFTPNWSSTNLVLTPSLYKLGTSTDVITSSQVESIKWFDAASPDTELTDGTTYGIPSTGLKTLTVKSNVLGSKSAIDFICEVQYRDTATNLVLTHKMSISFNKVVNGGGITDAIAWTPDGNVFKNDSVTSLTAECDLSRGAVTDTTNVSYQWYIKDPSVSTDEGGGIGWNKLDSTTNYGITGYTSRSITVPSSAVANFAVFKCIIKDLDANSNTYNQHFSDTVTMVDQSDNIQISISSSGGDVFKNGSGSTTLTAKVFRAGQEIDTSGNDFTYRWFKYDKNATLVTGWGGTTDYKTGKQLDIGDSDVDTKATFTVEIS